MAAGYLSGDQLRKKPGQWLSELPVEPRALAAIGLAGGLVLLFAKIAEDVFSNESRTFDTAIIKAMRTSGDLATPVGPPWMENAFADITSLGGTTVITLVAVIATAYLAIAGRPKLGLLTGLSVAAGALVEHLMKLGFDRARPNVVPHLVEVHSLSFPSGHAMLSAMTYLTLGALLAEAQTRWRLRGFIFGTSVALTLLIGVSRIYLGVHWPTDVLAGWTAGAAWALLSWFFARRLEER